MLRGGVLVNHVPANLQTKVYENFSVDCQITDKFHETEAVPQESMSSSDMTAIDRSHEPMSVGDTTDESQSSETVNTENITDEQQSQSFDPEKDFAITVNGEPYALRGKTHYILVDVLDIYPAESPVRRMAIIWRLR